MLYASFEIEVEAESRSGAGAGAGTLVDALSGIEGVVETRRLKIDPDTMDIGSTIQIIATSGATVALAQGVASWLRARRDVSLRIKRNPGSGSIEAEVRGIDPQTAVRIAELLVQAGG